MSYILAIDYGTSYTCAAISVDGRTEVLRFDGGSHLPSHVFLEEDGRLSVGLAAGNGAARAPERYERSPKRALGFRDLVLGDRPGDPREAVAAVLREVLETAKRHENGREPAEVRLTHPAAWGPKRKDALMAAARFAGIARPVLVSEPEAAVHHFANSPRVQIGAGDLIAVYDLGGGTFDTAVLRCTAPDRFELAGPPGGTAGADDGPAEIGGDVFDRKVYEYLGRHIAARDAGTWDAIRSPHSRGDRQSRRLLRNDAREAKENLSAATSSNVWVERISEDLLITREQFEAMIADEVRESIEILDGTLSSAGVGRDQLKALFLTGGSSRIPLVEETVKRNYGRADTQDDPKAIVALGAARMERPAAKPFEITVDRTEAMMRGSESGRPLTLYRVLARDASGEPITDDLRSFEPLAGRELVFAEPFTENGDRRHWMLSRADAPPRPRQETAVPPPRVPTPRAPAQQAILQRVTGALAIVGALLLVIALLRVDFDDGVKLPEPALIALALACLVFGVARAAGRDLAPGILALLGAAVLAYMASNWPFKQDWEILKLLEIGQTFVVVAGVLELARGGGAPVGSGRVGAILALAGSVLVLGGSFLKWDETTEAQRTLWVGNTTYADVMLVLALLAGVAVCALVLRAVDPRLRVVAALAMSLVAGIGLSGLWWIAFSLQVGVWGWFGIGVWMTALGGLLTFAGAILLGRRAAR